jgi:hypothetical protein
VVDETFARGVPLFPVFQDRWFGVSEKKMDVYESRNRSAG